ncbi:S-adenosyl-L-methionine-dependent methyltransferase [Marasmius fiardii PR-910]|nr:S-adenosyl-L-methionine-dependent methyltransferase [Marasmius fiardii PR-910]
MTVSSSRSQIEALLELINSSAEEAMAEYEKTGHNVPSPGSKESHPLDNQSAALALKRAIRTLEAACERLCTTLAQPMHTLVNRAMSYEASCLNFVTQEGIADIIEAASLNCAAEGIHIDDIAARTKSKVSPEKLRPVMLLLATRGCFSEVSKDVYANNRISLPLLTRNPISPAISLYSSLLQAVSALPEALAHPEYASSKAVNRSAFSYSIRKEMKDASYFDWTEANPDGGKLLQQGMAGMHHIIGSSEATVQAYPWKQLIAQKQTSVSEPGVITFCDLGSGVGMTALALSKIYANNFRVVLQDLPEPLEQAKSLWSVEHPGGDVSFVPMDFLKEPPAPEQDVYYMSLVIHDWPDNDVIAILKKVASVMKPTSRLLLHEHVLQHCYPRHDEGYYESNEAKEAREPLLPNFGSGNVRTHNLNICLLSVCNSFERTSGEFSYLGQRAGLKLVKIWPLSDTCLIEYRLVEGPNFFIEA